jgi:hypothetical protein
MFNLFTVTMHVPGQITADHELFFQVPCTCTLRAVSAVASNDNGGTFDVGIDSDPDGFLDGKALGDSDVPQMYDLDDFNGAEVDNQGDDYPQVTKGDVVEVKLIDGETSPTDTTIVLWFQEG